MEKFHKRFVLDNLLFTFFITIAHAQNTQVGSSTFDMGFGVTGSQSTVVHLAVGQTFVGHHSRGNTHIESGFLADTLLHHYVLVAVNEEEGLPVAFALRQNYPNPFNPTTTIRYEIPKQSHVSLKVYSLLGQEIATLVDEQKQAGVYRVEFNASGFSSGVYFYRLVAENFAQTKKIILLK